MISAFYSSLSYFKTTVNKVLKHLFNIYKNIYSFKTLPRREELKIYNPVGFVKSYVKVLSFRMYKIIVITLTLVFMGCGIWGSVLIRQKFEPELLLPADSYMRQWKDLHDSSYPENGWSAEVYTGYVNYMHLANVDKLSKSLEDICKKV